MRPETRKISYAIQLRCSWLFLSVPLGAFQQINSTFTTTQQAPTFPAPQINYWRKSMPQNQPPARDTVACPRCNLRQYVTESCRRCHHALGISYIEVRLPDPGYLRELDNRLSVYRLIGRTLRRLRARNGMTQGVVAESVGINRSSVSRAERGGIMPSIPTLLASATVFGIDKIILRLRQSEPKIRRNPSTNN